MGVSGYVCVLCQTLRYYDFPGVHCVSFCGRLCATCNSYRLSYCPFTVSFFSPFLLLFVETHNIYCLFLRVLFFSFEFCDSLYFVVLPKGNMDLCVPRPLFLRRASKVICVVVVTVVCMLFVLYLTPTSTHESNGNRRQPQNELRTTNAHRRKNGGDLSSVWPSLRHQSSEATAGGVAGASKPLHPQQASTQMPFCVSHISCLVFFLLQLLCPKCPLERC